MCFMVFYTKSTKDLQLKKAKSLKKHPSHPQVEDCRPVRVRSVKQERSRVLGEPQQGPQQSPHCPDFIPKSSLPHWTASPIG